jgi:hypothetical protein
MGLFVRSCMVPDSDVIGLIKNLMTVRVWMVLALPFLMKIEGGVHGSAGGVAIYASCANARGGPGRHRLHAQTQRLVDVPNCDSFSHT